MNHPLGPIELSDSTVEQPVIWTPNASVSRGLTLTDWRQAFREIPSWLTSLVLHLLFFLTIMSVASPFKSQTGSGTIQLTLSFTKDKDDATSSAADVQLPQSSPESEAEMDPESSLKSQLQQTEVNPERMSAPPAPTAFDAFEDFDAVGATTATSKYAALTMGRQRRLKPVMHPALAMPNQQTEFDHIVDRFILFDIGKLHGRPGQRANREFRALGPEAFPALIRGLNKSANIRATCPVGVIAAKIMRTLQQSQDASLAQYALDHIGEGVQTNAPHFQRIVALRDRWIKRLQGIDGKIAELLTERGLDGEGETFELALGLAESPSDNLLVALDSRDTDLFIPALIALLHRSDRLTTNQLVRAQRLLARKNATDIPAEHQELFAESVRVLNQSRTKKEFGRGNRPEQVKRLPANRIPGATSQLPGATNQLPGVRNQIPGVTNSVPTNRVPATQVRANQIPPSDTIPGMPGSDGIPTNGFQAPLQSTQAEGRAKSAPTNSRPSTGWRPPGQFWLPPTENSHLR